MAVARHFFTRGADQEQLRLNLQLGLNIGLGIVGRRHQIAVTPELYDRG